MGRRRLAALALLVLSMSSAAEAGDELIVTAARTPQPAALLPTNTTVIRGEEIETMVGLLLTDPEKNHQRIHSVMQPAVDRFHALSEEGQEEFRDVLTRFTRIYSFLSQVVSFTDVKLERDYLFCRRLAQLVRQEAVAGIDLGDSVELTHLRMEQAWSGDASLDEGGGEVVTIYGGRA